MLKRNMDTLVVKRYRWACLVMLTALAAAPLTVVSAQVTRPNPPALTAVTPGATKPAKAHTVLVHTKRATTAKLKRGAALKPHAVAHAVPLPAKVSPPKLPATVTLEPSIPNDLLTARFESAPLRQVLGKLFDAAGVNYSIRSDVKEDTVSLSLRKVPLEKALRTVLQSVRQPLTYRVEEGTYFVFVRTPDEASETPRAPVSVAKGGAPKVDVSFSQGPDGPMNLDRRIEITTEQADVRAVLQQLLRGCNYTLAPDVQGTVTISLKNVPLETALQNILRQVSATYRVEGGIVQIVRQS